MCVNFEFLNYRQILYFKRSSKSRNKLLNNLNHQSRHNNLSQSSYSHLPRPNFNNPSLEGHNLLVSPDLLHFRQSLNFVVHKHWLQKLEILLEQDGFWEMGSIRRCKYGGHKMPVNQPLHEERPFACLLVSCIGVLTHLSKHLNIFLSK